MSEIQDQQTFERGKPINLVRRFFLVDPFTLDETLTDPGSVTVTIQDPNNVETSYVFGVDANLTRISTGVYLCALDPLLPVGDYRYIWVGTAPVEIVAPGSFTITESGVLPPDSPDIAVYGPCSPWISGDEVAAFNDLGVGSNTFLLEDVAVIASQLAYEASGRQFPGVCTKTVRPCRQSCGCWADGASGFNWFWGTLPAGMWPGGWDWQDEAANSCGCGVESVVRLAGYPVRKILSVTIGGVDVPEFDSSSDRNWRLDERRNLIRMADLSTSPPTDRFWPACFPAGTLVLTDRGLRPIERVSTGDRVLTHRNRWRKVLASRKVRDAVTLRIVGRGGSLRCTADHPILADDGGGAEWTEARDLIGKAWATPRQVERLAIPLPIGWSRDDLPENFWWFVGRWVGDGWTDEAGRVTICCGTHEREILAEELRVTTWYWRESGGGEDSARWRYKDDELCAWLRGHFGTSAHDKSLPAWLLGAEEEIRREFLSGYESADGYVGIASSGRGRPYTSIHTVSRELALGTRILATTLGRAAVVYTGRANGISETYRVNWPAGDPGEPYSQAWVDDEHLWGRVRSLTREDEIVPVYDLEVEEDHSFVAEGVVVHNCQDLSVPATEPGSFQIEYLWGADPPPLAKMAAAEMAGELWKASPANQGVCRLPSKVVQIARQGITMTKIISTADLLRSGMTGLQMWDAFISQTNPQGAKMRSAVFSPDMPRFAREINE